MRECGITFQSQYVYNRGCWHLVTNNLSTRMSQSLANFSILELLDKAIMYIELFAIETTNITQLFQIQKLDGKGYGMIATKHINAFTLILVEKPLLIEPRNMTQALEKELLHQFKNNLNKQQQEIILNLSNCNNDSKEAQNEENKLNGIYHTNCVGTGDSLQHKSGLFTNFARINHSCLPNCCMYFEGKPTDCIILKSLFGIKKGEEITIGYIPRLLYTFDQRQKILMDNYGFECKCNELCLFKEKYDELIIEYRERIKRTRDLKSILRAIQILNDNFNGYPSMMTHLFNICADICINNKQYDDAIVYIEKSIDLHLKCYGVYKRDRWQLIRRKIVLIKYKLNNADSRYDDMLQQYHYLFR